MSGAPGVGQKPNPLDKTEISGSCKVYFDKLTIPLVYSISFSLLNNANKCSQYYIIHKRTLKVQKFQYFLDLLCFWVASLH